jgi:hypothetical protein
LRFWRWCIVLQEPEPSQQPSGSQRPILDGKRNRLQGQTTIMTIRELAVVDDDDDNSLSSLF